MKVVPYVCTLVLATLSLPGTFARAEPPHVSFGPMVGHVGPNEARVWAKSSGPAELSMRVGEAADLADARLVGGASLADESGCMGAVVADGLKPSTRYHYALLLNDQPVTAPPYPSFVTAPQPGTSGRTRFAFVSCLGRGSAASAAAWGDMAERTPIDLLLMLGDNHYGDSTDPKVQRAYYAEQRRAAGFRDLTSRTPTYGIWDDHDYGPNNSDRTAKGKEDSLRTFKEHWANPSYGLPDDAGIYFKFSRGEVDFFMLDVRYHRSPNRSRDDGTKTMLGPRQLAWLKRELLASKAKVKFVAGGSEFQTNGHEDSWTSFARERRELWDFIRDNGIEGVILLSGDRHFTAGYQIENRLIEVTSGPLGSQAARSPNLPEMFCNFPEGKMYCVFDVNTEGPEPTMSLEVYRAGAGQIYRRELTWDEVNGRAEIPKLPPSVKPRVAQ